MPYTKQEAIDRVFGKGYDAPTVAARFLESGLTRYTYEEILAGLEQAIEAYNAYEAATLAFEAAVDNFVGGPDAHWTVRSTWQSQNPPEYLLKANELVHGSSGSSLIPPSRGDIGHGSSEAYPLRKWEKDARSMLSKARRINKLLEQGQKEATR